MIAERPIARLNEKEGATLRLAIKLLCFLGADAHMDAVAGFDLQNFRLVVGVVCRVRVDTMKNAT